MSTTFDVFLSHHSRDKPAVERIAVRLKQAGLEPWLDHWCLTPGGAWQAELEAGLRASRGCAVFVGPHGVGDWVRMELAVATDLAAHDRDFKLFLVLLPGLAEPFDPTTLPAFLNTRTWVDLRAGFDEQVLLQPLINAIVGAPLGPSMAIAPDEDDPVSPYRGLEAFDESHAEFFFGREADIQRLLEQLKATRFLAVVGPSGSGKSSLVRAGLIPAIRRSRLPGGAAWPVAIMLPGPRPLTALAAQLVGLEPTRVMGSTLDELRSGPRALDLAVEKLLAGSPRETRLLLVVDQFEEIFTLCRDEAERAAFLDLLLHAATTGGGRCLVILTLRADFYPRTASYPALAALVAAHQALIGPLDEQGLRDVIVEPAWRVGLRFEDKLVDTILDDVSREPGALPLLEHALLELWERRRGGLLTLEGYRASGGVRRAIATRADAVYAGLDPERQAVARQILLRLTQPGDETEDTRRRAEVEELVTRPADRPAIEATINALVEARLLTASQDEASGAAQVDVAHEALIRGWPRLRQWLEEDRQGLIVHRRLTEAAHDWQQADQDPDLLYRGTRLAEARALAQRQGETLNERERRFLAESEALRERERAAAEAARVSRERLRRRVTAGLATFSVVALALALVAGWQWREAQEKTIAAEAAQGTAVAEAARAEAETIRAEAETNRAETEAARAEAEARVALARQLAAQSRAHTDDLDLGLLLAAEAHDLNPDDLEVRRSLLAATHAQPRLETMLHGHEGIVRTLAFSSDGTTLASGSDDGTVRIWDMAAGSPRGEPLAGHGTVWSLAFVPNSQRLAFTSLDERALQLWDAATGEAGPVIHPTGGAVLQVAASPDGRLLATGTVEGAIALWDPRTGSAIGADWPGHQGEVLSLAFSPNSAVLVSAGLDNTIRYWDVRAGRDGQELGEPSGADQSLNQILVSPDASTLATTGDDGTIRLWDIGSGLPIGDPLTGHELAVFRIEFSQDGSRLFSAGSDGTIRQWEVATHQLIGEPIVTGQGTVLALALSPDGTRLASGGDDGSIRVWQVAATPEPLAALGGHVNAVAAVAYSPDGTTIATADADGTVILWDAAAGSSLGPPLPGHSDIITELAFSPDGSLLASAGLDGVVRLWDVAAWKPRGTPLLGHGDEAYGVAFSPDGALLASGGYDGMVRLWRTSDGTPSGEPLPFQTRETIYAVSFNPRGTLLAAADSSGSIGIWDVASRELIGTPLVTGQSVVWDLCFVDDARLISAGADATIRAWDVGDGSATPVAAPAGPDAAWTVEAGGRQVVRLACSGGEPARVASAVVDGRVLLWTVGAAAPEVELVPATESGFEAVAFSPDGSRLAYTGPGTGPGSLDQATLNQWDVAGNRLLDAFPVRKILGRTVLSPDGAWVATAGDQGKVVVMATATGEIIAEQRLPAADGKARSLAFSRDSARLAVGSVNGGVRLWEVAAGDVLGAPLGNHEGEVFALGFSPDGTLLASGADDGTVRLWNLATGQPGSAFVFEDAVTGEWIPVIAVSFSPDGSLLAVAGRRTIALWDVDEAKLAGDPLAASSGGVFRVAFSPDGRLLASGDNDGTVNVWDVASRQLVATRVVDLTGIVTALAFSPDGSLLTAASETNGIAIAAVDGDSGSSLGRVGPADERIVSLRFATDEPWLSSLDGWGVVSRWDLADAAWRARACALANRNLTRAEWGQYIGNPDDPGRPYHATCPDRPAPEADAVATPGGADGEAAEAEAATPVAPM